MSSHLPISRLPLMLCLTALLTAVHITGCASTPEAPGWAGAIDKLAGTWHLEAIQGRTPEAILENESIDRPLDMTIEPDGRLGGYAGVNQWFASLEHADTAGPIHPDGLSLGPIGATKMAGPPGRMALEQTFFDALARTTHFDRAALAEGRLLLHAEDGSELLRFSRRP